MRVVRLSLLEGHMHLQPDSRLPQDVHHKCASKSQHPAYIKQTGVAPDRFYQGYLLILLSKQHCEDGSGNHRCKLPSPIPWAYTSVPPTPSAHRASDHVSASPPLRRMTASKCFSQFSIQFTRASRCQDK